MFLFKIIMQLKMTYSYSIYYLFSRPQKLKIQDYQNIPIYKFILSNVPHDQLCRVADAIFYRSNQRSHPGSSFMCL